MAFPPGFLDELRARLSMSDIVGRKVVLKRRSGSEYAGLCPFHNEKTPSFTVNDKKGFFYCFGCHEKGDAVGTATEAVKEALLVVDCEGRRLLVMERAEAGILRPRTALQHDLASDDVGHAEARAQFV